MTISFSIQYVKCHGFYGAADFPFTALNSFLSFCLYFSLRTTRKSLPGWYLCGVSGKWTKWSLEPTELLMLMFCFAIYSQSLIVGDVIYAQVMGKSAAGLLLKVLCNCSDCPRVVTELGVKVCWLSPVTLRTFNRSWQSQQCVYAGISLHRVTSMRTFVRHWY